MKTNLLKSFCSLLLVLIMVPGCKKSSDTNPSLQYQSPSIATDQGIIQIPSKLSSSTDVNAQVVVGYMDVANAFSSYSSLFSVPGSATQSTASSSGLVYSWTYGNESVKLTYNDDGTNRTWTWYVNNSKYMDCKEADNSKSGSFNVYDYENGGSAILVYNWNKDSSNIYETLKIADSETYFFKITASLDNKSGLFDVYDGSSDTALNTAEVKWNSDGSGNWWIIEDSTKYSGSWTK
jgi:hypothetical protein